MTPKGNVVVLPGNSQIHLGYESVNSRCHSDMGGALAEVSSLVFSLPAPSKSDMQVFSLPDIKINVQSSNSDCSVKKKMDNFSNKKDISTYVNPKTVIDSNDINCVHNNKKCVCLIKMGKVSCDTGAEKSELLIQSDGTKPLVDLSPKAIGKKDKKKKRKSSKKRKKGNSTHCQVIYESNPKHTKHSSSTKTPKSDLGTFLKFQTVLNHCKLKTQKRKVYPVFPVVIPLRKKSQPQDKRTKVEEAKENRLPSPSKNTNHEKVLPSEKQSSNPLGIPLVPPCTPSTDFGENMKVVPAMFDAKSRRLLKATLTKLEIKQKDKFKKEEEVLKERANQSEKRRVEEEKKRLRQQQRTEIYALNKVLSALEKEKFEKLKMERSAAPV